MKEMEKGFPGTEFPGCGVDKPSTTQDDTEGSAVPALGDHRLETENWTPILMMPRLNLSYF